jgi:spermidine synthase
MIPWKFLAKAPVPDSSDELLLYRRADEFSIRVAGSELMNSRMHGSEDALAELAWARIAGRQAPRILIGGLGMGYTVAAALNQLSSDGQLVVAELVPAVVDWNREFLAPLAGNPLDDQRVTVSVGDVAQLLRDGQQSYDAILLDVDNGPEGLTRKENNWLYSPVGLAVTGRALLADGVVAYWSASPSQVFTRRLNQAGFAVEEVVVRARGERGGGRHTIWLASQRRSQQ